MHVQLLQHVELNKSLNTSLQFVAEEEQNDIIRMRRKYCSKEITKGIHKGKYIIKEEKIKCKMIYGYYEKNLKTYQNLKTHR